MKTEELREIQAPIRTRYRDDPGSAVITLRAGGDLDSDAVSCSVQTGKALVDAGLHPASGGDGTLTCSGGMLLQALVACAGVTMRSVAVNRGIEVSGHVRAEGDLDFRGTLGVDRDTPVGFREIRLDFDIQSSASGEELDALLTATERYCVVLQTLLSAVPVEVSVTGSGE
jgi:uncharacterized OsmC-like protein